MSTINTNLLKSEDAVRIPILDVGRIVVPMFSDKGNRSTGKCCKHVDKNLGNLRFNEKKNYAHCFSCGESFNSISMVMEYNNLNFQDALEFLYGYFPNYFAVDTFQHSNWKGLTTKEYNYLGISSQITFGDSFVNIREYGKNYPKDHDILLISKIIKMKENMEEIKEQLILRQFEESKIIKDENKIYEKLFQFLKKGLMSKEFKSVKFEFEDFTFALSHILEDQEIEKTMV